MKVVCKMKKSLKYKEIVKRLTLENFDIIKEEYKLNHTAMLGIIDYGLHDKDVSDDKRWMVFDRNTKAVSRRIYSGDKILDEIMSLVIEGTNNILKKLKITSDADILSWVNSAIKSKEIACDKDNMGELKYIRKVFEQRLRDSGYDN